MPERVNTVDKSPKKRNLFLQKETYEGFHQRATEANLQFLKNSAVNRAAKPKREMSEQETSGSIAGIMYNHIHRLEKNQDELFDDLNTKLNDLQLFNQGFLENFFYGENSIMQRGLHLAIEAHKIQKRKFDGQPYIVHPLRVTLLSIELAQAMGETITPELVIGALMHDVIEDSLRFHGDGGAAFTKEKVRNLFGTWILTKPRIDEVIAADADAFDHNTAMENGVLNDAKYYEKLKHWRRKVFVRRQIIKAADRIDNLLDPLTLFDGLYTPRKGYSPGKLMKTKFLDEMDQVSNPNTLPRGLHKPPEGSLTEQLGEKRIKYTEETDDPQKIIALLLPEGSFLRKAVQKAVAISKQTLESNFTPEALIKQLLDEMPLYSFENPLVRNQKHTITHFTPHQRLEDITDDSLIEQLSNRASIHLYGNQDIIGQEPQIIYIYPKGRIRHRIPTHLFKRITRSSYKKAA